MKTFILATVFWLIVLGCMLAIRPTFDRARWVNFRSDAMFPMSQFMDRLAKQEDSAKRLSMATEMETALTTADDFSGLTSAIIKVSDKYNP